MTTAHRIEHFSIILKMKKMKKNKSNEKECGEERLRLGRVGMRGAPLLCLVSVQSCVCRSPHFWPHLAWTLQNPWLAPTIWVELQCSTTPSLHLVFFMCVGFWCPHQGSTDSLFYLPQMRLI